jgi:hypothetical protein
MEEQERFCFSCGQKWKEKATFNVPEYGYDLCDFHASMAQIVGWNIIPINQIISLEEHAET